MTNPDNPCRICGDIGQHPTYACREMMFGTREEFDYFQCQQCGCLQISQIPSDLASCYPAEYGPHRPLEHIKKRIPWVVELLQKQRCRTALFDRHHKINKILSCFVDYPAALHSKPNHVSSILLVLGNAGIRGFNDPILDIGCGAYSYWLASLEQLGFSSLTGVDPFISSEYRHGRVTILRRHLSEIEGQFQLITLHHSLEHMPDQLGTFNHIRERLLPNGTCVVRIPTVSSRAWEEYRTNWVELDAPRHLYLHSDKSLALLAEKAGLEIFNICHDSIPLEFYGSEMYTRDLPLMHESSPWINPNSTLFTQDEMRLFEERAATVNREKRGGRAAFFLRRTAS